MTLWKWHRCTMSLVRLKVVEYVCAWQRWLTAAFRCSRLRSPPTHTFCLVPGNTALLGANLLFEMLCVLPGVKTM